MGWMRHHAIVVTSWCGDAIASAHEKAFALGCGATGVTKKGINSYRSFMVTPDGSKEGWSESDVADEFRDRFIQYLKTGPHVHEDGSSPLSWVYVAWPADAAIEQTDAEILDHGEAEHFEWVTRDGHRMLVKQGVEK